MDVFALQQQLIGDYADYIKSFTHISGDNYVLTTGTGSGKSPAYIIPIVDYVLHCGSGKGVQAIIVYSMNALANSQINELGKSLCRGFPEGRPPADLRVAHPPREEER
jgi:superfamily II DNA/RNA helicase